MNAPLVRARTRSRLLRMHYDSGVGHIGGNLSALDLLLYLFHDRMTSDDRFVLSKGHAAGAMYATLWSLGRLTDEDLATFHRDGTRLSGHPPAHGHADILFATGSLGHGPSLAAGLALAKKLQGAPGHVFCLTSDGEWNEGSCWEAVVFAQHHGLDNLSLVIDCNGLQGFGTTREVADLSPLAEKFRAFRLDVKEIDGHDFQSMSGVLTGSSALPRVVVARTHKGCGISFMEDRMEWHYLPLSESQFQQALAEEEKTCEQSSASRS